MAFQGSRTSPQRWAAPAFRFVTFPLLFPVNQMLEHAKFESDVT